MLEMLLVIPVLILKLALYSQQMLIALKESQDDEEDEDEDFAGEEEEDTLYDSDTEKAEKVTQDAPGIVSDYAEATRWWEGSAGFDFAKARNKQNEDDGMQVENDPRGWVGKIVKRSFGRGIISFGKVFVH